ncbi:glutathione S-transferase [Myxococcota bacterium]|nr:glutathione S-transferase [Myxococcota bacterium]
MKSPRYSLHYFDGRGRAEQIRLLLAHVGADWADVSFPGQEWPKHKAEMPLGQAPMLVEHRDSGDVKIPQSMAIMRHLARVHDAYGKTEDEHLAADIVAETCLDFAAALSRLRFSPGWKDAAEKEKYAHEVIPAHLARLTTVLGAKPFAAGDAPTFADMMAFDVLDNHVAYWPTCLADHPKLHAWTERVRALPTLAAYLPKRRPAAA